jgi:hypothetical protein
MYHDVCREYGFKLIDYANSKNSASLTEEIASAQKATQAQKLTIEKYIGTTKSTSLCASTTKRHFSTKGVSA